MAKKNEVYKCEKCGLIVEVLQDAPGHPKCCGEPMKLLKENTTDGAKEKHVPVIEKIEGGYRVTVGAVEHPMTEGHYIQWIECFASTSRRRISLLQSSRPTPRRFLHASIATSTGSGKVDISSCWGQDSAGYMQPKCF